MKNSGRAVTIYDIAAELNISAATVSRSLNNITGVNKKTQKRVLDTSREMGYNSNFFASGLRNRRTNTLGVIVPKLNSPFISNAIAGIENTANQSGYNLVISQSLEEMEKEINCTQVMLNHRVDGLIVSLAWDTDRFDHFESFEKHDVPVVFFDRVYEHKNYLNIQIDNFEAAYAITDHLVKQGCRKIVHITAKRIHSVYENRLKGYLSALQYHGIAFSDDMIIMNDLNANAGVEAARQILAMETRPDGIFSANDTCAIGCMVGLKRSGVRIPGDIAVAGFNDDPSSNIIEPGLTTVGYNGYAMGELAARSIIARLSGKTINPVNYSMFMPYNLIVRDSTKRIIK